MVLTEAKYQRRGFARRLLAHALETAEKMGIETIKLDATEQGRPIYDQEFTRAIDEARFERDEAEPGEGEQISPESLLAAFSRPPEARAEDVNGSILIAAESAAFYPGLKDAAQYFGPVTEVAKAQGFDLDGDPYGFVLGTKTLVRGDFEKNVGTRVMRQSTLVMLAHGYVVSLTFIGGTDDEVEELVQGLSFTAAAK